MKKNKTGCDLKTCFMCRSVLKEWLPAIEVNKKNFTVKKGEAIFREGDPVTGMYFVYTGAIKVHKKWDGDKDLIIRFAKSGDIVGHRGLGNDAFFPISATAIEPAELCFIDIDAFYSTLKVNPGLLFQLMIFFADELRESEKRMRDLAHMPVKGRLADALTRLKKKFGVDARGFIDISVSKQDIASYVGAAYETVFKILNDLEEEQAIEMSGKQFRIADENKLMEIALE